MEGWLSGWKEIARYIGKSTKTARKYHFVYSMPVRRGPENAPFSLSVELDLWLMNFDEKVKNMTK